MNLESKLEILDAISGNANFPANQTHRDGAMLLATNGYQLLAFHLSAEESATEEFATIPTLEAGAKASKKVSAETSVALIRGWLTDEKTNGRKVKGSALRDFLRADDYLRCPVCAGSGRRPVDEPDYEELEIGDPFSMPRLASILGAIYNANMLVSTMAYLDVPETVLLETWAEPNKGQGDGVLLRIAGDGWTLIQMNMREMKQQDPEVFPLVEEAEVAAAA
jgi:hypothetical protein